MSLVKYSYDDMPEPTDDQLSDALTDAQLKMWKKQKELKCWPDWRCIINGYSFSMAQNPTARNRIYFDMSPRLLYAILTRKIHWNNAETGCHIQIHREPNVYCPDIHTLMSFFHV